MNIWKLNPWHREYVTTEAIGGAAVDSGAPPVLVGPTPQTGDSNRVDWNVKYQLPIMESCDGCKGFFVPSSLSVFHRVNVKLVQIFKGWTVKLSPSDLSFCALCLPDKGQFELVLTDREGEQLDKIFISAIEGALELFDLEGDAELRVTEEEFLHAYCQECGESNSKCPTCAKKK